MKVLNKIMGICLLFSVPAFASDIRAIKLEDKDAICFDVDTSKILLQQSINYIKLNTEIGLLDEQLTVLKAQIQKQDELLVIKDKEFAVVSDIAANLQKRVDSATAWYKSPYLWTAIGFVVGVGVSIGIYYAVESR